MAPKDETSESDASRRFRERMNAHHARYQEQVEANREAERVRHVAARRKRKLIEQAWGRIVTAAMRRAEMP